MGEGARQDEDDFIYQAKGSLSERQMRHRDRIEGTGEDSESGGLPGGAPEEFHA
jgi:hypothetical protein